MDGRRYTILKVEVDSMISRVSVISPAQVPIKDRLVFTMDAVELLLQMGWQVFSNVNHLNQAVLHLLIVRGVHLVLIDNFLLLGSQIKFTLGDSGGDLKCWSVISDFKEL